MPTLHVGPGLSCSYHYLLAAPVNSGLILLYFPFLRIEATLRWLPGSCFQEILQIILFKDRTDLVFVTGESIDNIEALSGMWGNHRVRWADSRLQTDVLVNLTTPRAKHSS
jgi:hypothetical protein